MGAKFKVGQKVEVDLKRWLGVTHKGRPKWRLTEITDVFKNGQYGTLYGMFKEDAVRVPENKNGKPPQG